MIYFRFLVFIKKLIKNQYFIKITNNLEENNYEKILIYTLIYY